MSVRKPRNQRYTIKAYYVVNDKQHTFWCKENKLKNITNEMGAPMPMANGERMLETDSRLDFKINQHIIIGGDDLLIQDFNSNTDPNDLNSLRGKPSNIITILVK